mmetsp:Transcript_21392/g.70872  ORF Transcript_21392/g.70872 Transcript_21392/m.70872 type:complete len:103 (-) Transcript_21392:703-1011(-)
MRRESPKSHQVTAMFNINPTVKAINAIKVSLKLVLNHTGIFERISTRIQGGYASLLVCIQRVLPTVNYGDDICSVFFTAWRSSCFDQMDKPFNGWAPAVKNL